MRNINEHNKKTSKEKCRKKVQIYAALEKAKVSDSAMEMFKHVPYGMGKEK